MDEQRDIRRLIQVQIDEPALQKIKILYDRGLVTALDVEKFRVTTDRYKAAILAEHEALHPKVQSHLTKSLLSDYQKSVDRLILNITKRASVQPDSPGNSAAAAELEPGQQEKSATLEADKSHPPFGSDREQPQSVSAETNINSSPMRRGRFSGLNRWRTGNKKD